MVTDHYFLQKHQKHVVVLLLMVEKMVLYLEEVDVGEGLLNYWQQLRRRQLPLQHEQHGVLIGAWIETDDEPLLPQYGD